MTDRTGFHNSHHTQSPKVMFIDSKDANVRHVTDTHFTYVFNESIHVKQNEGVLVSLLQASIPYSFYNVRSGVNDTLVVRVQTGAGTFTHSRPHIHDPRRELHGDVAPEEDQVGAGGPDT